jgi:hypothetical protein
VDSTGCTSNPVCSISSANAFVTMAASCLLCMVVESLL